jgi:hypothetical protein
MLLGVFCAFVQFGIRLWTLDSATNQGAHINICNCSKQVASEISVAIEFIPAFNVADGQAKNERLRPGQCLQMDLRVYNTIEAVRLYVNGRQSFFEVKEGEQSQISVFAQDSLQFPGRHPLYFRYARRLPLFSIDDLEPFRDVIDSITYSFQKDKIQFTSLDLRLRAMSFTDQVRFVDSVLNDDLSNSRLLSCGSYYTFLGTCLFLAYEQEINDARPGYGELSFSAKESVREEMYSQSHASYQGHLSLSQYLDSLRANHWVASLRKASQILKGDLLERYIYVHAMNMIVFRPATYPREVFRYATSFVSDPVLKERLTAAYEKRVGQQGMPVPFKH